MEKLTVKIISKNENVHLIDLEGPLDSATVPLFSSKVERLLKPETKLLALDMRGVNYISSLGVGEIFKLRRFSATNKSRLVILNPQPGVNKVLMAVDALPEGVLFKSIEEMDAYLDALQNEGNR